MVAGALTGEFDLGQALAGAAFAGVSSWATSVINADTFGITFGEGAGKALLGFGDDLTLAAIVESGIDSAITAGLSSVVYDTDFGAGFLSSFGNSLATLATADFQTLIGDQGLNEGGFAHAGLHGLVGCISAAATGADCAAGALGGVVQSVYAGTLEGKGPAREDYASDEAYAAAYGTWEAKVGKTANLIGGAVGYVFSGGSAANVSATASIAKSGILNNYLSHTELVAFETELRACIQAREDCNDIIVKYKDISALHNSEMLACAEDPSCDVATHLVLIAAAEASGKMDDVLGLISISGAAGWNDTIVNLQYDAADQVGSAADFEAAFTGAEAQFRREFEALNCGGLSTTECNAAFDAEKRYLAEDAARRAANADALARTLGGATVVIGGAAAVMLAPEAIAAMVATGELVDAGTFGVWAWCIAGQACTTVVSTTVVVAKVVAPVAGALGTAGCAYEYAAGDPSCVGIMASGPGGALEFSEEILAAVGALRTVRGVVTGEAFVFRGTTEGFEGGRGSLISESTPTSTDPLVATTYCVNACKTNGGNGVVYVIDPSIAPESFPGTLPHDFEITLRGVLPSDVAAGATYAIPVQDAVDALRVIGKPVPATAGSGHLRDALIDLQFTGATPLSPTEIQQFLDLTTGIAK